MVHFTTKHITSVTPQNIAKIRQPTELSFYTQIDHSRDIAKKLFFQNFANLKCFSGPVWGGEWLKNCIHFLVPNNQTSSKN